MNNRIAPLLCCIALVAAPAGADQEAPNAPRVTASTSGDCYAKSIPDDRSGTKGRTRIYRVDGDADTLEHEFDWYAGTIHLRRIDQVTSVVRFGPWTPGYEAKEDDLALAFYLNGKLLRSYSTLDIAREAENVRQTASHYTWSSHVHGYCSLASPDGYRRIGFALQTIDGRTLSFDVSTGEIQPTWRPVDALPLGTAARGDNRSEAARFLEKPYPPAEKGMTRFAIILPKLENDGNYKVELIVGKKVMVDTVNSHFFEGKIETANIKGWGFIRYVVKDLGPMSRTLKGGPTELKEKFVTLESLLIRYNSRLPITVYVPEGAEVRYRIWSTTPESNEMPKG